MGIDFRPYEIRKCNEDDAAKVFNSNSIAHLYNYRKLLKCITATPAASRKWQAWFITIITKDWSRINYALWQLLSDSKMQYLKTDYSIEFSLPMTSSPLWDKLTSLTNFCEIGKRTIGDLFLGLFVSSSFILDASFFLISSSFLRRDYFFCYTHSCHPLAS